MTVAWLLMAIATTPPSTVTWADVRPILEQHCAACHQENGPAPFPLLEAADVSRRAGFIREVTAQNLMPPWIPSDAGVPLRGGRGLTDREKAILHSWAAGDHPIGEDAAPARPPSPPRAADDLVVTMPDAWVIPAEGGENWGRRERDKRTFAFPIGNARPLRATAVSHVSTAPTAIHAVTYLADTTGAAVWNDQRDDEPGTYMSGDVRDHPTGELGGTGVGARTIRLPTGFHWEIPSGADLAMEVHYRPVGRPLPLTDRVAWDLTHDPASRPIRTLVSMVRSMDVPVGETQVLEDQVVLEHAVDLVTIMPRAMGTCTSLRLTADIPGEGETVLFDAPEWDPHWRFSYVLEDPLHLSVGTVLTSAWRIENTEVNPRNPFIPLERLSMAKRTGAVAMLLGVAAEDDVSDQALQAWLRSMMRSRIR